MDAIKYTFSKRLFNPLYWELRNADTRFVISWGGGGSSKSFTQAQHEVVKAMERKEKVLVLRKVAKTLKLSVIPLIWDTVLPMWGRLREDWKYNKSDFTITNKVNGSQFVFMGMDDPEKIKSIQGITRVWVEEATEFDEADIDQLNIRLRGNEKLQITLTFNPIDELHWIKKKFFDATGVQKRDATLIHTTYLNNRFIDDVYKHEIEQYKFTDPNFYAVYGLGNWGRLTKGGEFYKRFNASVHVVPNKERDEELPLHISFDENVNPYLTLNVWQGLDKTVWQLDEIHLEDPLNTLGDTLREFYSRYPPNGTRVIIYGDATSRKADTKLEKGVDFYALVEKYFQAVGYKYEKQVPASNPSVELRGNFVNDILGANYDGCRIEICERCRNTIADYQYLKQASDGTKFKEMARHTTTKVNYQKWGHATDANDYFFCIYFLESFDLYKSPDTTGNHIIQRRKLKKGY